MTGDKLSGQELGEDTEESRRTVTFVFWAKAFSICSSMTIPMPFKRSEKIR